MATNGHVMTEPVQFLENIKNQFLQQKNSENAVKILNELTLSEFDYDVDHSEYWPDVCEMLGMLLKTVPLDKMLLNHQIVILMIINKAPQRVIRLIAKDYFMPGIMDSSLGDLFRSHAEAVIIAMSRRVNGELCNEDVAEFISYFVDMTRVQLDLRSQLEASNLTSEGRFRLYQVAISAINSTDFSNYDAIRFLIDSLVDEVTCDDQLSAITALEILSEAITRRSQNAVYLSSIGAIQKTYTILQKAANDVDSGLLFTASLRFFAHLCRLEPNLLDCYPFFVSTVFDLTHRFDSLDATTRLMAFQIFVIMASSNNAKLKFNTPLEFPKVKKTMNHFGVVISQSPDQMRLQLFHALAALMRSSTTEHDRQVLRTWFNELGAPFPTLMMRYLSRSVELTRDGVLDLLKSMLKADPKWSIGIIRSVDGFLELLLTRTPDFSTTYWQEKYDVLSLIADAIPDDINEQTSESIRKYLRDGVFYLENDNIVHEAEWGLL